MHIVKSIFKGNPSLKKYLKIINHINKLENDFEKLTDDQLKEKTVQFKEKLNTGSTTDDLKIHAFALVREASKRVLGLRHYDVQLLGGLALYEGKISEMQTGEGKTLVASLPSYLNALEGKGVHVITSNEYLAKRDFETIGNIHKFLGLTVGLNVSGMSTQEKQIAYNADITYGTGNEFGFDHLRDNMVFKVEEQVQRPLHFAIVDEVDSILIDEARTPLIIANKTDISADLYTIISQIIGSFKENLHFELIRDSKQTLLKSEGATMVEKIFGIDNLYDIEHQPLLQSINKALHAHFILKKDVDYIVRNGEIMLVDAFTGRIMEGRTYSDGLHQAIEAKENVQINPKNDTQASITIQNYFRMYKKLSGMTGTAKPSKDEFLSTYNLEVIEIPTNKQKARVDHDDLVFDNDQNKRNKIAEIVQEIHKTGRPILVGTTSIQQSEKISELLLGMNIPHQLLNAKTEEEEAKLISLAGQLNQITIATNMAGRGTDIMLGEGVAELGGLYIIGTERHDSKRIDLQLRGRAGRQGDPGTSQFVVSIEDEIVTNYDDESLEKFKEKYVTSPEGQIVKPDPQKFMDKVQQTVEGFHYSAREHLLKLDNVADQHRSIVYKMRQKYLTEEDILSLIEVAYQKYFDCLVNEYCTEESIPEEWGTQSMQQELAMRFPEVEDSFFIVEDKEELNGKLKKTFIPFLDEVSAAMNNEIALETRYLFVKVLDSLYIQHLNDLTDLKEGIHLRSYGQEDPYLSFEREGYHLFQELLVQFYGNFCSHFYPLIKKKINDSAHKKEREEVNVF
ncbi:accessory Sec system translocase SecA2 [Pseudalkalibacillus sp. R45]